MLLLSIFPGIDMLGRAFEAEGFCVVRGPDLIWGGDIRDFHPPAGRFDGIIGGSPCQDYSKARRSAPTGYGDEMLREFARVVTEAQVPWFVLENVDRVPDIFIFGYGIQRLDLNARECGMTQRRLRHIQFGSRNGLVLIPERLPPPSTPPSPTITRREQHHRTFADRCEQSGLPRDFDIPGLSRSQKNLVIANGVPIPMGRVIARAVRDALTRTEQPAVCRCGCGRRVQGKQISATPACRKRIERKRDRARSHVPGTVTPYAYL